MYEQILCIDNRGPILAAGNDDGTVKLYDIRSAVATNKIQSHNVWVSSININPINSNLYLTTSYDKSFKIWDIRANKALEGKVL